MNYGRKFLYIIISAVGMMILITGICYKTGYFPGHSDASTFGCLVMGTLLTVLGLINLHRS